MMVIEPSSTQSFLKGLGATLPMPKAILVVSAHWETAEPMITAHPHPELIYDFYGFPEELYQQSYKPPGAPDQAKDVAQSIPLAQLDPDRGLDHGAWVPLKLMYPEEKIPILQLSVQSYKDAAHHYAIGKKIAALREQGVLILASGNTTHNLRAAFTGRYTSPPDAVIKFSEWLHEALTNGDHQIAKDWVRAAPDALWNHPTPEHLLPLFVAMGAGGTAQRLHQDIEMNVLAMDAYSFA